MPKWKGGYYRQSFDKERGWGRCWQLWSDADNYAKGTLPEKCVPIAFADRDVREGQELVERLQAGELD